MWEKTGTCRIFVLRDERKKQIGRPRCRWERNIKMDDQEIGCGGVEWFEVSSEQVAGLFERGNELFLYPKFREFLSYLGNFLILRKDCVPWCYFLYC